MRYFRLSRDEVFERQADGALSTQGFEVLWPDGRSAPIADSFEDHLQRREMSEGEAQRYADERVGRTIDLHAPAISDEEHAAETKRLSAQHAGLVAGE